MAVVRRFDWEELFFTLMRDAGFAQQQVAVDGDALILEFRRLGSIATLFRDLPHATSTLAAAMATVDSVPPVQSLLAQMQTLTSRLPPTLGHGRAVVVEGLDGVGKSTVVKGLISALQAHGARTPPYSVSPVRSVFDALPETPCRAFYNIGNYLAAVEIADTPDDGRPWIVDRYYTGTAAYTIGNVTSTVEAVDALPSQCFAWPTDLPLPRLVILLTMNDAARMARLRARGVEGWGPTEERQARDPTLGSRIATAYARVQHACQVTTLDASQSPEAVLAAAIAACRAVGL